MKSYTDIEQSKTLAKILPIESADMWWNFYSVTLDNTTPLIIHLDEPWIGNFNWNNEPDNIPAWSLDALLEIIHKDFYIVLDHDGITWTVVVRHHDNRDIKDLVYTNEPIDSCVEMIQKLHELNLL